MPARRRGPSTEELQPITLENQEIIFRNFSGLPGRFNADGDRNFNLKLDDETARLMEKDGLNVKWLEPRIEGDSPQPIVEVKVKYKKRDGTRTRPPKVVLITSRGKTHLTEDMITVLDFADIVNVDLIVNPRRWEIGGRGGISLYLKAIYVTINEDQLEQKYHDVPDSAASSIVINERDDDDDQGPPWSE